MDTNRLIIDEAFNLGANSLKARLLKEQANINIHTLDCINYKYFFTETYPCLQGYEYWTDNMVDTYLNHRGPNCKYYLPELDSSVVRFWEGAEYDNALVRWYDQEEIEMPPRIQGIKCKIEKEWNFIKHLAEKLVIHNDKCLSYKKDNGKFGCLKDFINWNATILDTYKSPKKLCTFDE